MPEATCRGLLAHGAAGRDAVIVEGVWKSFAAGGDLNTLRDWFGLPAIAVVNAAQFADCFLPPRPKVDALLLDGFTSHRQFLEMALRLEVLWGIPVLGGLPEMPVVRGVLDRLPAVANPAGSLCRRLGDALAESLDVPRFLALASSTPCEFSNSLGFDSMESGGVRGRNVAVALDECFTGPFPETIELLETMGSCCRGFSPLRQEHIPADVDCVVLGDCRLEAFAELLAVNHCFWRALRAFAAAGGAIYAEGASLPLLARTLEFADGRCLPMAGILPGRAVPVRPENVGEPVQIALGEGIPPLRCYRGDWTYQPNSQNSRAESLLWRTSTVCGSEASIHFAAQAAWLRPLLAAGDRVSLAASMR